MRLSERWAEWRGTSDGFALDASVWLAKKEEKKEAEIRDEHPLAKTGFDLDDVGRSGSELIPEVSTPHANGHSAFIRGEIAYSGQGEDNRY